MSDSLLLDTYVFLWWIRGDRISIKTETGQEINEIIEDEANLVYISTITAWEIAMLKIISQNKRDRGEFLDELIFPDDLDGVVQYFGFQWLAPEWRHALHLPNIIPPRGVKNANNDPADHWLVAQALGDNLTFVTADGKIIRDFSQTFPILKAKKTG